MKCGEFEVRLDEILDERRRPEWDSRLHEHCDSCQRCRDLAAAYGVLLEGVSTLDMPEAPGDLAVRVLDAYQVRPRSDAIAAWAAAVFSSAAAVLVAFFLTRDANRELVAVAPSPAPASVQQVERGEQVKFDPARWKSVPLLGAVFASATDNDASTDPYAELAKETGRGLANVVLMMPGVAGPRGVRPPEPPYGSQGASIWPAQMSDELRPVTESVNETFNLILDSLPVTFWSKNRLRES